MHGSLRLLALAAAAVAFGGADDNTGTPDVPPAPAPAPTAPVSACTEEPVGPKLLSKPKPVVPKEALRKGVEGSVEVSIDLNSEGQVTVVSVSKGLGYGVDEACETAWKATTWQPATLCGVPVAAPGLLRDCTVKKVK
jgi:protein TonB